MTTTEMRHIQPGDAEWPAQLSDLTDPPAGLWVMGEGSLAELTEGSIAIIGARASTAYGDVVAAEFAEAFSNQGRSVVSGGAYGIDAAAHRACMTGATPTVAVLASGLDQPTPPGHASLFDRIAVRGVLVSEVEPGGAPSRDRFLERNRLIAALSVATLIVEASERSGSTSTVNRAISLGRPVFAIPGAVTSALSVAPNRLIRDRLAFIATDPTDVLIILNPRITRYI